MNGLNPFTMVDDPLYRLAITVLGLQFGFVILCIIGMSIIRLVRPRYEAVAHDGVIRSNRLILEVLAGRLSVDKLSQQLMDVPRRSIFSTLEQMMSRVSPSERIELRYIAQVLKLESYALKMTYSWFWWRRLEGVLRLSSVGTDSSGDRLSQLIHDKDPSVSFYAATSLARIQQDKSRGLIFAYLSRAEGLSFAQRVRLLRELNLTNLNTEELIELFQFCPDPIKPELIEATVLSAQAYSVVIVRLGSVHASKEVRIAAFKAASLSRLDLREQELRAGLEDPAWEVRAQAVKAVNGASARNLIPALTRLLGDSNWWVRQNASKTLSGLGEPGIRALNITALDSEDRFARDAARLALSEALMVNSKHVGEQLDTMPIIEALKDLDNKEINALFDDQEQSNLYTQELNALLKEEL